MYLCLDGSNFTMTDIKNGVPVPRFAFVQLCNYRMSLVC